MINVLIVDDERIVRKAYQSDIETVPDRYRVIATVASSEDAKIVCAARKVDLILMDINTAGAVNGIEAAAEIKKRYPRIRIIITTSYLDLRAFDMARKAGADSFWLKDLSQMELVEIMDRTMAGESIYPEKMPDAVIGNAKLSEFTPKEIQVLYLLLEYVSVKKIAEVMVVEESTVKTHLLHMFQKVGCSSKVELAVLAANAKLAIPRRPEG